MSDYIKNAALPPKKKKNLSLDNLTIRVSFGSKFKITPSLEDSVAYPDVTSPCWCRLDLLKFIDVNILTKKN